jgi:uncharacterized protein YdeI (YjbR/CyaY-like superfamily)
VSKPLGAVRIDPTFFATPARFRAWLRAHHRDARLLWVGFYKRQTGRPSITWPEAVDEALCYGWIDGLRKRIDDECYMIRFSPRQPRSTWSAINIARVKELTKGGRMSPAGLGAFAKRTSDRSAIYSYEQRKHPSLTPAQTKVFRAHPEAWAFLQSQPAGYRRLVTYWIVSAKKQETQAKRLATLMAESAAGRRIGLVPPASR